MTIQNTFGLVASIGGLGALNYYYQILGSYTKFGNAILAVFGAISLEKLRREWILRLVHIA